MSKWRKIIASVLVVCIALTSEAITALAATQNSSVTQTQSDVSLTSRETDKIEELSFSKENAGETTVTSNISLNKTSLKIGKGKTETLTAVVSPSNNSTITWTSSSPEVAIVDASGKITAENYGTTIITATVQDGSGISASATVVVGLNITYFLDGGTNHTENPSGYYQEAVTLKNPTRAGYLFKGWYVDDKYKSSITVINAKTNLDIILYAKWAKIAVGKTRINSLQNRKGKKLLVTLRKLSGVSGYEIVYTTDKTFKKDCITISTTTTKNTIESLTKKKTYYVKVRAYTNDSAGAKIYGNYCAIKKLKIIK